MDIERTMKNIRRRNKAVKSSMIKTFTYNKDAEFPELVLDSQAKSAEYPIVKPLNC